MGLFALSSLRAAGLEKPLPKVNQKVYTIISSGGKAEVRDMTTGVVTKYKQFRRYNMNIDVNGNVTLQDIGLGMRGNVAIIDKIISAGCFRVTVDYQDNDNVIKKVFDCEAVSKLSFFGEKVPWSTSGRMIVTIQ